jgi:molybdenum cofactor guanylyltransferase
MTEERQPGLETEAVQGANSREWTEPAREAITGVILAGGQGRRMGGADKGLLPLEGRTLIARAIAALAPQVRTLLISSNRHRETYAAFGWPVLADADPGYLGPLAGVAEALRAAATPWVLCIPCDAIGVPPDLADRLGAALVPAGAEIAVAHDGERLQALHALIATNLAPDLAAYLAAGGRSVQGWYGRHRLALVDMSDQRGLFANLNTPADLPRPAGAQGDCAAAQGITPPARQR